MPERDHFLIPRKPLIGHAAPSRGGALSQVLSRERSQRSELTSEGVISLSEFPWLALEEGYSDEYSDVEDGHSAAPRILDTSSRGPYTQVTMGDHADPGEVSEHTPNEFNDPNLVCPSVSRLTLSS